MAYANWSYTARAKAKHLDGTEIPVYLSMLTNRVGWTMHAHKDNLGNRYYGSEGSLREALPFLTDFGHGFTDVDPNSIEILAVREVVVVERTVYELTDAVREIARNGK